MLLGEEDTEEEEERRRKKKTQKRYEKEEREIVPSRAGRPDEKEKKGPLQVVSGEGSGEGGPCTDTGPPLLLTGKKRRETDTNKKGEKEGRGWGVRERGLAQVKERGRERDQL